MAYWDNERVLDYLTSSFNRVALDTRAPRLFPVKIYIESAFEYNADGSVDDLTRDSENAIGDFEDLAGKVNLDAADNDNFDVPVDAYAVCKTLNTVRLDAQCTLPSYTVFRGYVTEEHLDAIDAIIYHYTKTAIPPNHVKFHIRKL